MSDELSQGEAQFLDQYTRKMMVSWCNDALMSPIRLVSIVGAETNPYVQYAVTKKWLGKSRDYAEDPSIYRVLSAGWKTAAAFLKR